MRDYQIASPSLEGVLNHDSLLYEGLIRPLEILRVLDGPAAKGRPKNDEKIKCAKEEQKVLERYFQDLYSIFMKKLSHFVVDPFVASDETVKLQAMLQEMIKIKGLMSR